VSVRRTKRGGVTGCHYDDTLPAGWREYDERDEYQAQIADDLTALLADIDIPW
jgi:hypothetical protein